MLNRRKVLGLVAAGTMAIPAFPAIAQEKQKLRFSAVFSEQDIRAEMMKQIAEAIGDSYQLDLYYGGTLFNKRPKSSRFSAAIWKWATSRRRISQHKFRRFRS